MVDDALIAAAILQAVHARGAGKTICPSEAARALANDWRPLMPEVRRVAQELANDGQIATTQKGQPVRAQEAKGPIRLGLP
ncbi:DUF3253 domain-containing protein [Tateyamaria omphalii]|uniref:DUF3253 domain-containing protein n=1 Tax=Tateyamaria omphalii TaxID=299262 RepID=UPI001C9915A1|nr:DUF3253 domain-containing protein [Tateyamaria omphalii]MBY5931813.1 DUF3253 domain-containing protein [Tateyamaria omphalii]